MKKIYLAAVTILLFAFSGCLETSDSPESPIEAIGIQNYTDSAVYVYCSCEDSLPRTPELKLFEKSDTSFLIDNLGNKIDSIYSPRYRINAYSSKRISLVGMAKSPIVFCKDKTLRLFIIKEKTMRSNTWEDVWKSQLFYKKVALVDTLLIKNHWTYIHQE